MMCFVSSCSPVPPTSPPPTHPPINPKIVWSDEYLPSKPLSCLGLYSSVRWPNPHQKTRAPSRLHLFPSSPFFSLALYFSLSTSPLFSLGLSLSRLCSSSPFRKPSCVFNLVLHEPSYARSLSLSLSLARSRSVACSHALPPLPPCLSLLLVCQ